MARALEVKISVMDTDLFHDLFMIMIDMFEDEAIPEKVKDKYSKRIQDVIERVNES